MPSKKSPGFDGITSEDVKFAGPVINGLLAKLFTMIFINGYLPPAMIKTVLVPILKSRSRRVSDKSNYRLVALSTTLSKIFEKVLFKRLKQYLNTCENQFGFKSGHGTELCIFTLKELLSLYTKASSYMFVGLLDASATFDRVNHVTLMQKLFERDVPLYLGTGIEINISVLNWVIHSLDVSELGMESGKEELPRHGCLMCTWMV